HHVLSGGASGGLYQQRTFGSIRFTVYHDNPWREPGSASMHPGESSRGPLVELRQVALHLLGDESLTEPVWDVEPRREVGASAIWCTAGLTQYGEQLGRGVGHAVCTRESQPGVAGGLCRAEATLQDLHLRAHAQQLYHGDGAALAPRH